MFSYRFILHSFPDSSILIELIEVFINAILYAREVYPSEIFRQRKHYNTAIYVSVFPKLNDYLRNILYTALNLQKSKSLFRVHLVIYDDDDLRYPKVPLERYVFDLKRYSNELERSGIPLEQYLSQWDEEARSALLDLNNKIKGLNSLRSRNTTFKVFLETTQTAYIKIINDSKIQVRF